MLNKIRSVTFGHAIGDALGVPVEFCSRDSLKQNPIKDMIGFGTHKVPAGTWSDDTSMSLCALESLSTGKLDYDDIMRNFCAWYYRGQFTTDGKVFDIGNTCASAIDNYAYYKLPVHSCGLDGIDYNGNGSLMRIYPFVLFGYYNNMDDSEFVDMIAKASALTHAHQCSIDGCIIYAYILKQLLSSQSKDSIYHGLLDVQHKVKNIDQYYNRLFMCNIKVFDVDDIISSGYVVDTLEAAIWSLLTTDNYKDCVLNAVNLGSDTDTVGAVAGSLAGALYGIENIPNNWINELKAKNYIEDMCNKAYKKWSEK